ncbi:OmpW family protein [Roseateles sp. BYS180W]|uniref:OmpW family protein n=1 Tax=Roseateles rivi TaxID=3299028 RepID=A0ABW7FQY1_9BURK
MKKTPLIAAAVLSLIAGAAAAQQAGDIVVRARAVHLDSANGNNAQLTNTLASLKAGKASINDKWLPEVDISYFFSPNLAAELILTYPQKQTLSIDGLGKVGSFKHLPPTLTLQYHFLPNQTFRPYVGAGLNFTHISSVKFDANVSALNLNLKRQSYGLAFQVGFDVALDKNWLLNVDLKKVQIGTTVSAGGTDVGKFKVDPLLLGVGVGYRF